MTSLPLLYIAVALLCAALVLLTLWARREVRVKVAALALGAGVLLTFTAGAEALLGRPYPLRLPIEAEVLAALPAEGKAIYLWLAVPGNPEPFYVVMPWDRARAEELQGARERAGKEGKVKMAIPFEDSLEDREPMFHPLPQPAMPLKQEPVAPMEVRP